MRIDFTIRQVWHDKDGQVIFIREQPVSEHDTLLNAMRRMSVYTAQHVDIFKPSKITMEITPHV